MLPSLPSNRKPSKNQIVSKCIDYINELKTQLQAEKDKNQTLERKLALLENEENPLPALGEFQNTDRVEHDQHHRFSKMPVGLDSPQHAFNDQQEMSTRFESAPSFMSKYDLTQSMNSDRAFHKEHKTSSLSMSLSNPELVVSMMNTAALDDINYTDENLVTDSIIRGN